MVRPAAVQLAAHADAAGPRRVSVGLVEFKSQVGRLVLERLPELRALHARNLNAGRVGRRQGFLLLLVKDAVQLEPFRGLEDRDRWFPTRGNEPLPKWIKTTITNVLRSMENYVTKESKATDVPSDWLTHEQISAFLSWNKCQLDRTYHFEYRPSDEPAAIPSKKRRCVEKQAGGLAAAPAEQLSCDTVASFLRTVARSPQQVRDLAQERSSPLLDACQAVLKAVEAHRLARSPLVREMTGDLELDCSRSEVSSAISSWVSSPSSAGPQDYGSDCSSDFTPELASTFSATVDDCASSTASVPSFLDAPAEAAQPPATRNVKPKAPATSEVVTPLDTIMEVTLNTEPEAPVVGSNHVEELVDDLAFAYDLDPMVLESAVASGDLLESDHGTGPISMPSSPFHHDSTPEHVTNSRFSFPRHDDTQVQFAIPDEARINPRNQQQHREQRQEQQQQHREQRQEEEEQQQQQERQDEGNPFLSLSEHADFHDLFSGSWRNPDDDENDGQGEAGPRQFSSSSPRSGSASQSATPVAQCEFQAGSSQRSSSRHGLGTSQPVDQAAPRPSRFSLVSQSAVPAVQREFQAGSFQHLFSRAGLGAAQPAVQQEQHTHPSPARGGRLQRIRSTQQPGLGTSSQDPSSSPGRQAGHFEAQPGSLSARASAHELHSPRGSRLFSDLAQAMMEDADQQSSPARTAQRGPDGGYITYRSIDFDPEGSSTLHTAAETCATEVSAANKLRPPGGLESEATELRAADRPSAFKLLLSEYLLDDTELVGVDADRQLATDLDQIAAPMTLQSSDRQWTSHFAQLPSLDREDAIERESELAASSSHADAQSLGVDLAAPSAQTDMQHSGLDSSLSCARTELQRQSVASNRQAEGRGVRVLRAILQQRQQPPEVQGQEQEQLPQDIQEQEQEQLPQEVQEQEQGQLPLQARAPDAQLHPPVQVRPRPAHGWDELDSSESEGQHVRSRRDTGQENHRDAPEPSVSGCMQRSARSCLASLPLVQTAPAEPAVQRSAPAQFEVARLALEMLMIMNISQALQVRSQGGSVRGNRGEAAYQRVVRNIARLCRGGWGAANDFSGDLAQPPDKPANPHLAAVGADALSRTFFALCGMLFRLCSAESELSVGQQGQERLGRALASTLGGFMAWYVGGGQGLLPSRVEQLLVWQHSSRQAQRLTRGLASEGICALSQLLRANDGRLTKLSLRGRHLSDTAVAALGAALEFNDCLIDLDLSCSGISDRGAALLAEALKFNYALARLDLRGNLISDAGAVSLGASLEFNTTVQRLELEANKVSFWLTRAVERELNTRRSEAFSPARPPAEGPRGGAV